jgi:hypothetical protein
MGLAKGKWGRQKADVGTKRQMGHQKANGCQKANGDPKSKWGTKRQMACQKVNRVPKGKWGAKTKRQMGLMTFCHGLGFTGKVKPST